jgi:hypothetical protein
MTARPTFRQFLAERTEDDARRLAAQFLDTTPDHLEPVDKGVEEKVLDTGRELKHEFIKMVGGAWVIRLFAALSRKFARVESPSGESQTFQASQPSN